MGDEHHHYGAGLNDRRSDWDRVSFRLFVVGCTLVMGIILGQAYGRVHPSDNWKRTHLSRTAPPQTGPGYVQTWCDHGVRLWQSTSGSLTSFPGGKDC